MGLQASFSGLQNDFSVKVLRMALGVPGKFKVASGGSMVNQQDSRN